MKQIVLLVALSVLAACGAVPNPKTTVAAKETEQLPPLPGEPQARPDAVPPMQREQGSGMSTGRRQYEPLLIRSIAIAADGLGASVAYALEGIEHPTVAPLPAPARGASAELVGWTELRRYSSSSQDGASLLYGSDAAQPGMVSLLAAAASGRQHWFLHQDDKGAPTAAMVPAPAVPGGAVISAAVSSVGRQTQSSSFGEMVRSNIAFGSPDGSVSFLMRGTAGDLDGCGVAAGFSTDAKELPLVGLTAAGNDLAVGTMVGGKLLLAYRVATEASLDGPIMLSDGRATSLLGVPAAIWDDGSGAFPRVVVKIADSIARYSSDGGATTLDLPRSDEASCTAVTFTPSGDVVMLSAGPQSAVLYTVTEPAPGAARLSTPNVISVRDHAGPPTSACAIAVGKELLHVAWVEDRLFVVHAAFDLKTVSNVQKTRHDTVKNSISNIR